MFRIKPVLIRPVVNNFVTRNSLQRSSFVVQTCRAASSSSLGDNFTFLNQMYSDLSQSSWVMNTQHLLETVHDYTHLPWWATIVVTTVSLRLAITLPLAAYQVFIVLPSNFKLVLTVTYCFVAQHLCQAGKSQARNGRYFKGTKKRD